MKIKHIAVATILSLTATSSFAADWYLNGSLGHSSARDESVDELNSELIALGVTGLSTAFDDSDTAYKLQLGYRFTPNWAVEGGYIDLGNFDYSATFTGPVAGGAAASLEVAGLNLAAVGSYPVNEKFDLFAKLGVINAKVRLNATATGSGVTFSEDISKTNAEGYWGVGAGYQFNEQLGTQLEWERFNDLGDEQATGEGDVDLISLGIRVAF